MYLQLFTTWRDQSKQPNCESNIGHVQFDDSLSCLPEEALEVFIENENLLNTDDFVAPNDNLEPTEPDQVLNTSSQCVGRSEHPNKQYFGRHFHQYSQ
jgi:hypothetical protein